MNETEIKELAFLRDLYLEPEWTRRFADLFDRYVELDENDRRILYVNAGTGGHVLSLRERLDEKTKIVALCEDEQILKIARSKASALKAKVDFAINHDNENNFDAVFADASLVTPKKLESFIAKIAEKAKSGGKVCFFTITSGSFGEIFSFLWEVLFNEDLGGHGAEAENLIRACPTVSQVQQMAKKVGLTSVRTYTSNEIFEYRNANEMINSVLISKFFVPEWLKFLSDEQRTGICCMLARLIDDDYGDMSFRFSVKATLIKAKKP